PKIAEAHSKLGFEATVLDLGRQGEARTVGVLHRDLKPSNILVTDETSMKIRLVDLGLATTANETHYSRVGTREYLPPDWGAAPWDVSFDLYAAARGVTQLVLAE